MEEYLKNIAQKFARLDASNGREMIYRTDFELLLKQIFQADGKVTQINHDSTNDDGNKPDFVISKNGVPILYIEAKDIGISLDKIEKSNQMERYFGYDNLVLTDYVEFRFYRNGERYGEPVAIASFDKTNRTITAFPKNFSLLPKTLVDFSSSHKEPIKRGKHLAQIMGGKAQRIRGNVREMLANPSHKYADLLKMRNVVREHLVSGLDDESFADMYAQTLVYGLFAARYNDTTPEDFSRTEARELVPKTNPFLRSFFDHIAGTSFPDKLRFIVDELCEVFTHADVEKILRDFYQKEKDDKDPVIHFYEDFLKEYDSKKKMEMGVFYTPRPVVQFIVRAVDSLLKSEFGLEKGLTDTTKVIIEKKEINNKSKEVKVQKEYHKVQVLDVATGTGTFLNEVINHIHENFKGQEGRWPAYVENDLLPRLHGFELMMASYTIAHLKLGMTLHDTGADNINTRLGVYLTNTLDAPIDYSTQDTLFGIMDSIAEESKNASRVKSEYPIMCVIGNPPYSGESMNPHYTDNDVYKVEIGGKEKLKERNSKWINDDYVKFIRFAESLIEKNGEGIVGMITAHGYIDNPTFRGMRWHLRNTFDKIYVVDLHGNSRKKEISPDGTKDENVFDIMSGVSIILAVKKFLNIRDKKLATVHVSDMYGTRDAKFQMLDIASVETVMWVKLPDECDVWKLEGENKGAYSEGFSVSELFTTSSVGIVTGRDAIVISEDKELLKKNIIAYANNQSFDYEEGKVCKINYRPFDTRYIYYDKKFVERGRWDVMQHLINKENIGLMLCRQQKIEGFQHVLVHDNIVESSYVSNKTSEIGASFPLYLYPEVGSSFHAGEVGNIRVSRIPNIDLVISRKIAEAVGSVYYPVAEYNTKDGDIRITPENILDYIYAYLYSPSYRTKYSEFLKTDFPRVPYPKNKEEFWKLVPLGTKLRELHLMTASECNNLITSYPVAGSDTVEKIKYENGNVYINDTQYFGNVPEVAWNFYIGGYQPAQKWLKDRKTRTLTNADIEHYQKIIVVLTETDNVMREIDEIL
ncbi:MAG: type ISP restriction/modification enzyme [Minisyncoccia bacterium]